MLDSVQSVHHSWQMKEQLLGIKTVQFAEALFVGITVILLIPLYQL